MTPGAAAVDPARWLTSAHGRDVSLHMLASWDPPTRQPYQSWWRTWLRSYKLIKTLMVWRGSGTMPHSGGRQQQRAIGCGPEWIPRSTLYTSVRAWRPSGRGVSCVWAPPIRPSNVRCKVPQTRSSTHEWKLWSQSCLLQTSRFGVIPKSTPGKWRLIVNLSAPEGASVNDGINDRVSSLSYVTVDDAAREVLRRGARSLLAKVDVESAYRAVSVHPDDRWLLGMQWDGGVFVDTALPFGLRSAPKIFNALADAATWILKQEGVDFVIHYCDDFLLIGAPDSQECAQALATVKRVFGRLGLPIAINKLEGPAWCLTFLGIEVDTIAMELRLPSEKLIELKALVESWLARHRSRTREELESLIGKLNHACKVVRPGKTFMRRMFELLTGTRRAHYYVHLSTAMLSDLRWWATFMEEWNGASLLQEFGQRQVSHKCWTDASGSFGCGAVWGVEWLQVEWPTAYMVRDRALREESITLKELVPVVLACAVWGRQWSDCMVVVHCDNEGAVAAINSGYSRVAPIMHLLRCLFFIRARRGVAVKAVHIPGRLNTVADAISRDNLAMLFAHIPEARNRRRLISPDLWNLLVGEQPDWTSPRWARLFGSCMRWHWGQT